MPLAFMGNAYKYRAMDIGIIGLNFKTARVEERETLAKVTRATFANEETAPSWFQGVVLLTCNRAEIYFSAEDLGFLHSRILNALRNKILQPFEHQLYSYFGRDCFRHLVSVTAGLDSAIIAESEIQRQVKVAYDEACLQYDLAPSLHFLFQKSLKIAKRVRALTPLLQPRVELKQLVYGLWCDFFRGRNHQPILFVGNSQINRHILTHFKYKKVKELTLCTRSVAAVEEGGIEVRDWSILKSWAQFRLIICASSVLEPLLKLEMIDACPAEEKTLILDLGMPRNVCPKIKRHPGILLLDIDDLSQLMKHHKTLQSKELESCAKWIEDEVDKQVAIYHHKMQRAVEFNTLAE